LKKLLYNLFRKLKNIQMKKIISIISVLFLTLIFTSCAEKEKIDTSKAPAEIKDAIEMSYQLSNQLTDMQVAAGSDKVINAGEISVIGVAFKKLAIVNNYNLKNFKDNKFFIALNKERKNEYDALAKKVVFLKDCEGYDALGLEVQKIALEVKDVTELPVEVPVVEETTEKTEIL